MGPSGRNGHYVPLVYVVNPRLLVSNVHYFIFLQPNRLSFRLHNNMNIALAIMPSCKNYPKCKEDRSECPVVPSIDSMSCSFGCSAEDFYDEAEKYLTRKGYWGGYRMIVFRDTKDDDYAISWPEELPNNNGCNKHLDLGPFFPFRIVYVRNP